MPLVIYDEDVIIREMTLDTEGSLSLANTIGQRVFTV